MDPSAYNSLAEGESEFIEYSYNVIDGNGGSVTQTVTITITGLNDAPVLTLPNKEYGSLPSITDGSVSDTGGPLDTVGLMPAIGGLLEFLSSTGLLPQFFTSGQGTDTDSTSESFHQIRTLLHQALFGETQESQDQSWNSLLSFVSGKKPEGGEEWLELEEFFVRLRQWQIGKTLDESSWSSMPMRSSSPSGSIHSCHLRMN